jgi:hypothetical protein
LLGYSTNPEELATKVDLLALARRADLDELRTEVGGLRGDLDALRDRSTNSTVTCGTGATR